MLCFLFRGLFTLEMTVNKSWNFKVAPSAIGAVILRSTILSSVERYEAVFSVTNDFPGSLICVRVCVCVCEGERTCACVCGGGGNGTHEQYRRSHEPYPLPHINTHTLKSSQNTARRRRLLSDQLVLPYRQHIRILLSRCATAPLTFK